MGAPTSHRAVTLPGHPRSLPDSSQSPALLSLIFRHVFCAAHTRRLILPLLHIRFRLCSRCTRTAFFLRPTYRYIRTYTTVHSPRAARHSSLVCIEQALTSHTRFMSGATAGTVASSAPATARPTYMCPICNMGVGHKKRQYSSNPASQTIINKSEWEDPAAFGKHIIEDHIDIFKRLNSTEYTCSYCECAAVRGHLDCRGRFQNARSMVDHLREHHVGGPRRLQAYSHFCDPSNTWSYLPFIRDRAMALQQL